MDGPTAAPPRGGDHRALVWRRRPAAPGAAVLLLHGGREYGEQHPGPVNLPGLRMRGFARSVEQATARAGIAVGVVRYRCRGWNGERADAARDALAALSDLAEELGPVPTVLIGHSMGGRAALRAGGHPVVTGVVALAPWCPPDEPVEHLDGRRILLLHGDLDTVTDPADTELFAARAREAGARVAGYRVARSGHTLMRRAATWHRTATRLTTGLLDLTALPPETGAALDLHHALDGGLALLPLP